MARDEGGDLGPKFSSKAARRRKEGLMHRVLSAQSKFAKPFLCLLVILISCARAAPGLAAEKLVFGWSAIAGSQAVPWIIKDAGLFEKHGLDATLIYLDGGSRA